MIRGLFSPLDSIWVLLTIFQCCVWTRVFCYVLFVIIFCSKIVLFSSHPLFVCFRAISALLLIEYFYCFGMSCFVCIFTLSLYNQYYHWFFTQVLAGSLKLKYKFHQVPLGLQDFFEFPSPYQQCCSVCNWILSRMFNPLFNLLGTVLSPPTAIVVDITHMLHNFISQEKFKDTLMCSSFFIFCWIVLGELLGCPL